MIKDITIGQFFPGNSFVHKLDPRAKILFLIVYIVALFLCRSFFSLLLMLAFSLFTVILSRISPKMIWKSMKAIFVIVVFTAVLQIVYNDKGDVLWKPFASGTFAVTTGGVYGAVFLIVRIIALILLTSLLTYTTSATLLTDAIEKLLSPLKLLHVPVHSLAMMMTIALRFIPTLLREIDIIMSAQKARGAMLDNGSMGQRIKALVSVFVPLLVSSFRRASELATAMECRCYTDGANRTRLRVMRFSWRDAAAAVILIAVSFAAVFLSFCPISTILLFQPVIS